MAKQTNKQANEEKRKKVLEELKNFFNEKDEDIIQTSSNKIAFPFVNSLDSDEWVEITVSIPLGSKGEVFDGYERGEQYAQKQLEKKEKEEKKKEEKEKKKERDKKIREKKKENAKKGEK